MVVAILLYSSNYIPEVIAIVFVGGSPGRPTDCCSQFYLRLVLLLFLMLVVGHFAVLVMAKLMYFNLPEVVAVAVVDVGGWPGWPTGCCSCPGRRNWSTYCRDSHTPANKVNMRAL